MSQSNYTHKHTKIVQNQHATQIGHIKKYRPTQCLGFQFTVYPSLRNYV